MKIRKSTEQRIEQCPWKGDIYIDRSSFVGTGVYGVPKGKECHTVYCAADGPNPDGTTFHHGSIGFWNKFSSIDEANEFAVKLWRKILLIIGIPVPVYASKEDKNEHARWCMRGADARPEGVRPEELPTELSGYMSG